MITTVAVVIAVAYMGLWTFISVPQLTDFIGGRDIDYPVFPAIAAVAGPTLFWAFVGLGLGLTSWGGLPGSPAPAASPASRTGTSWPPPTATASTTGCSSQ
ncbi:hypothetical protein QFZ82_000245 [Streptomyces sp. V4I23]|uniref:hypothetical protein n=1 Tax=Streptomyces sp. V4I23 TaxID=3042282 RepID=UPI00278A974C|nr:hypothetical protein [Streptomyces sp. V4I23]MDQ1005760.1 hypothetical protein [Streptomyces sp. V4I23]